MLTLNVGQADAANGFAKVASGPARASIGTGKWSFAFYDKRRKPVLKERPGAGISPVGRLGFRLGEDWKHATRVKKIWKRAKSQMMLVATTDPSRDLKMTVTPASHGSVRLTARIIGPPDGVEAIGMSFRAPADQRYLGFGERSNSIDQRGNVVENWVGEGPYQADEYPVIKSFVPAWGMRHRADDTYFPMPWLLSTSGYGVLVENSEPSYFHLGTDRKDTWRVELVRSVEGLAQQPAVAPVPESITLRFFAGPTPADVVRRLSGALGRQPSPAPFFFGPWVQPRGDAMATIATLRESDVPTSLLQTYLHYLPCQGQIGQEQAQREFTDQVHANGMAITAYFNPMLCTSRPLFNQLGAAGQLTGDQASNPYEYNYLSYHVGQFDFTNPAAVDSYGELLREALDQGYDGWMEDFGEYTPPDSVSHDGTSGMVEHNRYPQQYHCAAYEQTKSHPAPVARFTRSGFTGSAACSPVVWGGDPSTTWDYDGLRDSIRNGLSMGLSGVGVWGSDIGGFFSLLSDALSPELLTRWVQFGAFSGVMRSQADGLGKPRPQIVDPDQIGNWRRYAKLRTQLYPYIRGAATEYRQSGMPMMRAMALQFPEDRQADALEDQYMFGDGLLVAPVAQPGQTTRSIYLPKGKWIDFWRSFSYDEATGAIDLAGTSIRNGGGWRMVEAPLEEIPLMVRAGAMITTISADIDTLSPFGKEDRSISHLDESDGRTVYTFPRGTSSSRFEARGRLASKEDRGRVRFQASDDVPHRWTIKVSNAAMRRPRQTRCVTLGTRKLPGSAWSFADGITTIEVPGRHRQLKLALSSRRCS